MSAELKSEFDSFAHDYNKHVNDALPMGFGEVDRYARIKAEHLTHLIRQTFPGQNDLRILDNGCGVGITDSYLKKNFSQITGCDMSKESLEFAQKRNPEQKYILYDGRRLPFADQSFDVAFAICVVHHVPPLQWEDFFADMLRVLAPGGLLVICEHNPYNPLTRQVVSKIEFDRDAVLIHASHCKQIVKKLGAIQTRIQYITFLPFESNMWLSVERKFLSWLPLGAQYQFSSRKEV